MSITQLPLDYRIRRRLKTAPVSTESYRDAARPGVIAFYVGLALLVVAVFGQTVGHSFINYDDPTYVTENARITAGLTFNGIVGAFTQPHAQNWHPLTTLSHMLDCQLWGLNPGGHHLTNLLLHIAASLLLFGALRAMTGNTGRSLFVAAIFAIHPLRVESVAWIAERKDVLSGVLFMTTILAYVHYVREQRIDRYLLALTLFALALMSKPTVIALPVLLFLLDYWPLQRDAAERSNSETQTGLWRKPRSFFRRRVFLEKVPFFILSGISAVITLIVQRHTVEYNQVAPLTDRLANAAFAYVMYLGQMFWPAKLAVFYPQHSGASVLPVAGAVFLLITLTVLLILRRQSHRYLFVGWCWYVVSLIPASGVIQVGLQAHADRYTYLPGIGLVIAVTWYVADLAALRALTQRWVSTIAVTIVLLLGWRASVQASFWKDSETLWRHALVATTDNEVAHNNLGAILAGEGKREQAIDHYQAALRITPRVETHNHLSPAIIENSLGNVLAQEGNTDAAIEHYRAAIEIRADFVDARSNLSAMLLRQGKLDQAIAEYRKVVATPPEDAMSHQRLAAMLTQEGRYDEAVGHYRRALQLAPNQIASLHALAWILASSADPKIRNGDEALMLAERANQRTDHNDPVVLRIVAAAYAACGRSHDAIMTAQRALSRAGSNPTLAGALKEEIATYQAAEVAGR